jgi:hypothetical protein
MLPGDSGQNRGIGPLGIDEDGIEGGGVGWGDALGKHLGTLGHDQDLKVA